MDWNAKTDVANAAIFILTGNESHADYGGWQTGSKPPRSSSKPTATSPDWRSSTSTRATLVSGTSSPTATKSLPS